MGHAAQRVATIRRPRQPARQHRSAFQAVLAATAALLPQLDGEIILPARRDLKCFRELHGLARMLLLWIVGHVRHHYHLIGVWCGSFDGLTVDHRVQ